DFKVVVQLQQPPPDIRPGLSCTAKITTATARDAVVVPLQAVVERDANQIHSAGTSPTGSASTPAAGAQLVQGVFVFDSGSGTAEFTPATTGVTGVDRIQVLSGVSPDAQVITGPYSAL